MRSRDERLKVMVVDDHHNGAEALGKVLSVMGADVRVLFSGEEAIDAAKDFQRTKAAGQSSNKITPRTPPAVNRERQPLLSDTGRIHLT